uniref:Sideroflexin-2 n=1 Tax=Heterorhabditis bacteriophora TaxID=37862 RepID=A0A1I7X1A8_HETBA
MYFHYFLIFIHSRMSELVKTLVFQPDISKPRWNQGSFEGRARVRIIITSQLSYILDSLYLIILRILIFFTVKEVFLLNFVLILNKTAPPLVGRLVPFVAVCVANAINIPLMRRRELTEGIDIVDSNGNKLGQSKSVAFWAITQVVISRIGMAAPTFALIPVIVNALEKKPYFKLRPHLFGPLQTVLCGIILSVSTPLGCAFFPQITPLSVTSLESELQTKINSFPNPPSVGFDEGDYGVDREKIYPLVKVVFHKVDSYIP